MDWFPSYTQCSSPSGWYKVPVWAIALLASVGVRQDTLGDSTGRLEPDYLSVG